MIIEQLSLGLSPPYLTLLFDLDTRDAKIAAIATICSLIKSNRDIIIRIPVHTHTAKIIKIILNNFIIYN